MAPNQINFPCPACGKYHGVRTPPRNDLPRFTPDEIAKLRKDACLANNWRMTRTNVNFTGSESFRSQSVEMRFEHMGYNASASEVLVNFLTESPRTVVALLDAVETERRAREEAEKNGTVLRERMIELTVANDELRRGRDSLDKEFRTFREAAKASGKPVLVELQSERIYGPAAVASIQAQAEIINLKRELGTAKAALAHRREADEKMRQAMTHAERLIEGLGAERDEVTSKNDALTKEIARLNKEAPAKETPTITFKVEGRPHRADVAQLLSFFKYDHLPFHLQAASKPFAELASHIAAFQSNDETVAALRKLLEAKDAAVRGAMLATSTSL